MERIEVNGACLCGAVSVATTLKNREIGACHCGMCRKWGGGPLFAVECDDEVHFEGEAHISVFASSDWAERGFCRNCGTHLFYRLKQGPLHALPLGLFGEDVPWHFDHQVFIDAKPNFYAFANPTKNLTGEEVFAQFGASEDEAQGRDEPT